MRSRIKSFLAIVSWSMIVAGVWMLGYCVTYAIGSLLYQHAKEQELLAAERLLPILGSASKTAGPKKSQPREGTVIGRLTIARLGLSTIVIEGAGERDLEFAAGHITGTALPGRPGNIAIAAHRDTFFRPLRFIRKDDSISLTSEVGTVEYRVISTSVVKPTDVQVLFGTSAETLTLVTCYPFYYVGRAPNRFIVRAVRRLAEENH